VRSWILTVLLIGTTLAAQTQTTPSSEGAGKSSALPAQTSATPSSEPTVNQTQDDADDRGVRLRSLPKNILQDQRALFTSPFRMSEEQW